MRHVPDGVLRRLDDEPLAVPDRVTEHVAGCRRCTDRRAEIVRDTEYAARLFSVPHRASDPDLAWARLRREVRRDPSGTAAAPRRGPDMRRRNRLPRVSLRAGLAVGTAAVVIAGTAAAASLTTIFAPTHVVPVSLSQGDLRAVSALVGLDGGEGLGGFATPDGSTSIRFGRLRWSSAGPGRAVASPGQAGADAGFAVALPTHLPAGVGPLQQVAVQPRVAATVTFNAAAGRLAGSSVTLNAGPAVLAQYGGRAGGAEVPALGVAAMRRPTAASTGASLSQIEAFLLGQPGIPPGVAEEVRLLGDLRTIFPVPVPPGAAVRSVRVAGWPGVLLTDSSRAAAAVVWEDGRGLLHVVAGILDPQDVLNVAQQVG